MLKGVKINFFQDCLQIKMAQLQIKDDKLAEKEQLITDQAQQIQTLSANAGKEEEANEVRKQLKKAQFELGNIAKQLKMKEEYVVWAKEDIENQRKNHEEDLRMHEEEIKNLRLSHETKLDSLKARLETEYNLKTETLREENKRLLGTNTSKISMLEDELR